MADDITIRRALPADLPSICEIETACFAIPWSEASLRSDLEDHPQAFYLAACAADGTVTGYAAMWRAADEGMVTNVAVTPSWRGKGIGKRLLVALVSQASAEGLACLSLEVREGNQPARHLYEAAGFEAVGIRRGYYEDNGEDAIIMLKKLKKREW